MDLGTICLRRQNIVTYDEESGTLVNDHAGLPLNASRAALMFSIRRLWSKSRCQGPLIWNAMVDRSISLKPVVSNMLGIGLMCWSE